MLKYIIFFIILTSVGMLYDRYKNKFLPNDDQHRNDMIQKFLLNDSILSTGKPILWIHTSYNINARMWPSFYGRNTKQLNEPYIEACIESIIKHCGDSFNICLIDNNSFDKLIPGWNIDISRLADPVKKHMEILGLTKLLFLFGGFLIPNSTIILKDLHTLFSNSLAEQDALVVEGLNRTSTASIAVFTPNTRMIGCLKNSSLMEEYMKFLEQLTASDYTDEMDFIGQANKWLYKKCLERKIKQINGKHFGIRDSLENPVYVDNLLSNSFIDFHKDMEGLYLPHDEILKRTKYEWFPRMNKEQVMKSATIAGKYLLISHGQNK